MDYDSVYLKQATLEDVDLLFQWANDSEVRKNSFQNAEIKYEDHIKWFEEKLHSDNCKIYIYYCENEPTGQIRINIEQDIGYIDYSIDKKYRLCGHAKRMLLMLEKQIHKENIGISRLAAKVKESNIASQAVFENLDYKNKYIQYEKELRNDIEYSVDMQGIKRERGGVLLLTNNRNSLSLFQWIKTKEQNVYLYSEKIYLEQVKKLQPILIVSYNYMYIVEKDIIKYMPNNIINLHISLLPWNRGFSPNLWSFLEKTPKGVTIHLMNEELDKGDILCQKELFFNEKEETFESTYSKLNDEIQQLFIENWERILKGCLTPYKPTGYGSYHSKSDYDKLKRLTSIEWDENISEFITRFNILKEIQGRGK